jgi:hypothetical protein
LTYLSWALSQCRERPPLPQFDAESFNKAFPRHLAAMVVRTRSASGQRNTIGEVDSSQLIE